MNPYIEKINIGINTVIFDLGQVLLSYDWRSYLTTFGYNERMFAIMAGAIFQNEDWEKGDEGLVTAAEWEALLVGNAPEYEATVREVFAGIRHTIAPFAYTDTLVTRLKEQGYRLYYLSNYSELLYEQTKHHMGFLENFDGGIFSFREKCIKPNPKIFRSLLERYQIQPEAALYFDDVEKNVLAARDLLINSEVFTMATAGKLLAEA